MKRKPHKDNPFSTFAPRTKGIRKVSAKKRKELAETDAIRHWYIEAGYPCQVCRKQPATECHEITAGAHRHRAVHDPDAQLYICGPCHRWAQGLPYATQIVYRLRAILNGVNECHGSNTVTFKDVVVEIMEEMYA